MNLRTVLQLMLTALLIFGMTGCDPEPDISTAIVDVNLVPMTSERVIDHQTVLVAGSRIVAIGKSDSMKIPRGAQVIDGNGAYLMPGLADMHMHTRLDWEDHEKWSVHPLSLYLANGVTTIRDFAPTGTPLTYALQWRDEILAGTREGPTIYTSGKLLYASPLDDPSGIVRGNYENGFDFLKLYSYISPEEFQAAMRAAKELGMYTSGHIPFAVGFDGVLVERMDEIAHVEELFFEFIEFDKDSDLTHAEWLPYIAESALHQLDLSSGTLLKDFEVENIKTRDRISNKLQAADISVCTTMVIDDVIMLKLFQPEVFLDLPESAYFEQGYIESFHRNEEKHQVQCRGIEGLCVFKAHIDRWILSGLHNAGVILLLGTDAGTGGMGIVPGFSIHDELQILVENGFTPYEAIATGTINAASVVERMTGEGNFGSIEVGNRADLILVKDNPLEDIITIEAPLGVMAAGKWYSSDTLSEMIQIVSSG
jgi:hypothetical protein